MSGQETAGRDSGGTQWDKISFVKRVTLESTSNTWNSTIIRFFIEMSNSHDMQIKLEL